MFVASTGSLVPGCMFSLNLQPVHRVKTGSGVVGLLAENPPRTRRRDGLGLVAKCQARAADRRCHCLACNGPGGKAGRPQTLSRKTCLSSTQVCPRVSGRRGLDLF